MASVLVTGANRGIGLELVTRLLQHANPPRLLLAGVRDLSRTQDLEELTKKYPNLRVIQIDVNKPETFPSVAEKVLNLVGEKGLNVLVNNAGVGSEKIHKFEDVTPAKYFETFTTNTVGPIFLTQALLPLIKLASAANSDKPQGMERAAILNMSSLLGSLTLNQGGYWGYRESKAALNQSCRSLACELKGSGILVVALHPGWVRTTMGGPEAPVAVADCGEGLINIIYQLDESKNDKFIQFDGKELEW